MKLTFYGQSCFAVVIKGKKIIFDPFITSNPAAKDIDMSTIEADYIFVTHGHGDHVADLVALAKQTEAVCVIAAEGAHWLQQQGVKNVFPLNHGGFINFDFGQVKAVSAVHSSSFPDGSYAGNPLGFVFKTEEGNFYNAGDTGLTMDMQLLPYWTPLNFATLPIGGNYTMDVADAIIAADFIKCDTIVGIHYNTFPVITINTDAAINDFAATGKTLLLPAIGEMIDV